MLNAKRSALLSGYPLFLPPLSPHSCYNKRNVRGTSAKILLGFLIVTLIAPTLFFARPQKAEALISLAQCIAAQAVGAAQGAAAAVPAAAFSVMTIDATQAMLAGKGPAGQDWIQCFMKGLVRIIAKTLLHTFTQSIVNWINTGFEGSPSFVTNPEGFLTDIADQTIGRVIEDISPLLCSPFRLDIQFDLGLNLSLNTQDEIHCRLSDVIANVRGAYDGFVQGAVGSGNLSRWIHIAGTPQNNPYGAYIATTNKLSIGITTATGQQIKLLDWGKGFRSWRSCEEWGPQVIDASGRVIRKGPCLKEGPIKTPGSIIQDQTSGALGTTLRELELADEIDEIVGALINQLLVKAITGSGGLLGVSKGSITSGGRSAAEELLTDPEQALVLSNAATPPTGIDCRLRYYPSTKKKVNSDGLIIYVVDDSNNQVWTDNFGVGRTVGVEAGNMAPIVPAKYELTQPNGTVFGTPDITKNSGETWKQYFDRVRVGCANQFNSLIADATKDGLNKYSEETAGSQSLPTPPPPPPPRTLESRQISLWEGSAALNQSYVRIDKNGVMYGPQNALSTFSWSDTYGSPPGGHWWTASLNKTEKIKIIDFVSYPNEEIPGEIGELILATIPLENAGTPITAAYVALLPQDKKTYFYSNKTNTNAVISHPTTYGTTITFNNPVEANAILISKNDRLVLSSLRVYRPAETSEF